MNTTEDLKTQVSAAVAVRWDDFAQRHPHLAGVIDQAIIIENVAETVSNDPQYQQALADVRMATVGIEAVVSIVDGAVTKFIGKLMGG